MVKDALKQFGSIDDQPDQAAAITHLFTSGQRVQTLQAPAGSGKSFTVGAAAKLWEQLHGGRVYGIAPSQIAADNLKAEGVEKTGNVERFLRAHARIASLPDGPRKDKALAKYRIDSRTLLIIDEASMVSTPDLAKAVDLAVKQGATVLVVGDPEQLGAVGAGGGMKLLVDRTPTMSLDTVRRFDAPWEKVASLRLRSGDLGAIAEYDRHGRILEGTAEEMVASAVRHYAADSARGKQSLVVYQSNEQAGQVASMIQAQFVEMGKVDLSGPVAMLHNGCVAGPGDDISVRKNVLDGFNEDDRESVVNRQVFHVKRVDKWGAAHVQRVLDDGSLGPVQRLPKWYLETHTELAYASTVHAAQGRTLDTCHSLLGDGMDLSSLYVSMTRGRSDNVLYVPVEFEGEGNQIEDRREVIAKVFDRNSHEAPALDVLDQELAEMDHLAKLGPIYSTLLEEQNAERHQKIVRHAIGRKHYKALKDDRATAAFYRLLYSAEVEGHSPGEVMEAIGSDLKGARSVAQVLHYRLERHLANQTPKVQEASTFVSAVSLGQTRREQYLWGIADAMDRRVDTLGAEAALAPPAWAVSALGELPTDPLERAEWTQRAGRIAAYRERYGVEDIGPAPGRGAPEKRAMWFAAHNAMGAPPSSDTATASTAELHRQVHQWKRVERVMPENVDAQLRETEHQLRDAQAEAVLAGAAEPVDLAERAEQLREVADLRAEAYAEHSPEREQAKAAMEELRERAEPVDSTEPEEARSYIDDLRARLRGEEPKTEPAAEERTADAMLARAREYARQRDQERMESERQGHDRSWGIERG